MPQQNHPNSEESGSPLGLQSLSITEQRVSTTRPTSNIEGDVYQRDNYQLRRPQLRLVIPERRHPALVFRHHPVERFVRYDGKIGVVIKPDNGIGWSSQLMSVIDHARGDDETRAVTALTKHAMEIALFDKDVVGAVLVGNHVQAATIARNEMDRRRWEWWREPHGLQIRWMDAGEQFLVHDYDGQESLWLKREMKWFTA